MDKRDVFADQVGVAARKAGIKMLPSIGKPDLQVAADVLPVNCLTNSVG